MPGGANEKVGNLRNLDFSRPWVSFMQHPREASDYSALGADRGSFVLSASSSQGTHPKTSYLSYDSCMCWITLPGNYFILPDCVFSLAALRVLLHCGSCPVHSQMKSASGRNPPCVQLLSSLSA